jgi:hypothetical protein
MSDQPSRERSVETESRRRPAHGWYALVSEERGGWVIHLIAPAQTEVIESHSPPEARFLTFGGAQVLHWTGEPESAEPDLLERPLPAIGAFDFPDVDEDVSERIEDLLYGDKP